MMAEPHRAIHCRNLAIRQLDETRAALAPPEAPRRKFGIRRSGLDRFVHPSNIIPPLTRFFLAVVRKIGFSYGDR
jgi:hypothetical protein